MEINNIEFGQIMAIIFAVYLIAGAIYCRLILSWRLLGLPRTWRFSYTLFLFSILVWPWIILTEFKDNPRTGNY